MIKKNKEFYFYLNIFFSVNKVEIITTTTKNVQSLLDL